MSFLACLFCRPLHPCCPLTLRLQSRPRPQRDSPKSKHTNLNLITSW
jgi:hypothetical protein